MTCQRVSTLALTVCVVAAACSTPALPNDAGPGAARDTGSPDALAMDAGPTPASTMSAELNGEVVVFEMVYAVSHTIGRTIEFAGVADDSGYPEIRGTLAFEPTGLLAPCGVTAGVDDPSLVVVRLATDDGIFAAPDGLWPESACEYDVVTRARCPGDLLSLRFTAELRRGAERLSIRNGILDVPVEFLLHGEPPPDGC